MCVLNGGGCGGLDALILVGLTLLGVIILGSLLLNFIGFRQLLKRFVIRMVIEAKPSPSKTSRKAESEEAPRGLSSSTMKILGLGAIGFALMAALFTAVAYIALST